MDVINSTSNDCYPILYGMSHLPIKISSNSKKIPKHWARYTYNALAKEAKREGSIDVFDSVLNDAMISNSEYGIILPADHGLCYIHLSAANEDGELIKKMEFDSRELKIDKDLGLNKINISYSVVLNEDDVYGY